MTPERIARLRQEASLLDNYSGFHLRQCLSNALDEIERLQAEIDRRTGKRHDCQVCGERVPFTGFLFCSEKCGLKPLGDAAVENDLVRRTR